MDIHKAVITAAGMGTRFLPQTKAMPKELLPIIDKPVIQYVVEEAAASGLKDIIFVVREQKTEIKNYFSKSPDLEKHLKEKGKKKELAELKKISELANFNYVQQTGSVYGNAMPIISAQPLLGNEYFVYTWGDEFIWAEPPRLAQMIEVWEKYQGAVISAVRIEKKEDLSRYGVADVDLLEDNIFNIKNIIEKPLPSEAPSDLATHGAYILPPEIFDIIKKLKPGEGGEVWIADAVNQLIREGFPVFACEIKNAKYYDTGNKLEYLKTVVEFALSHPDFSKDFKDYLKGLDSKIQ